MVAVIVAPHSKIVLKCAYQSNAGVFTALDKLPTRAFRIQLNALFYRCLVIALCILSLSSSLLILHFFWQGVGNTLKKHYETYLLEYELAHDDVDGECCILCHR